MRPCSAALKSFLEGNAREAVQIDLYTFSLIGGTVFRWSGGNAPLTVPAAGFPSASINAGANRTFALGPSFGRSKVTTKIGIDPSELDIAVYSSGAVSGGYTFAQMAHLGLLDGATVELDRFFAPASTSGIALDTSLGCLVWFRGKVADIEIGRSVVTVKVKSPLNRLATTQFPARLYASTCSHVFGAPMCGYDRVAGKNGAGASTGWGQQSITALAGSVQSAIHASYVPGTTPSPYIEGTITGLTGANAGASRTIDNHAAGVVYFAKPFLSPVSVGDTFQLLPGCSHNSDYCDTVLNNLARFGGFPNIPPPEAAI